MRTLYAPPPATPPSVRSAVRVVAVDAMPLTSYGLHALISRTQGLAWCGSAISVPDALRVAESVQPHVVLVDSRLDRDARGARALLRRSPRTRLIGVVRDDHLDYVRTARAAGVHGVVRRSAEPATVAAAIRSVCAGRPFLDPRFAPSGESAERPDAPEVLSRRQREILALIGQGHHNAEIAGLLFVSVETVRTHVKEMLRRLSAHDRAHAVARGYQLGILPATEQPAIHRDEIR